MESLINNTTATTVTTTNVNGTPAADIDEGSPLLINAGVGDKNRNPEEELTDAKIPKDTSWLRSKRWKLAYLIFFGSFFLYALRVNLSVSIVCMTNSTTSNTSSARHHRAEFDWSETRKSNLLSSYFYGYLVLQGPGGWLAGRYGASRVVSLAMAASSVCTLLIPLAARHSIVAFYMLRVLIGLSAGSTLPAFQSLWGRWAPPQERSRLASFAYSGGYLGSITTFSLSGVLCDHGFDGGWPSIFYGTGGLGFLWTLLWFYMVYDSPSSHPTISREEKAYIINSLKDSSRTNLRIPWRGILTSAPFWSLIVAIVAMAWVDYTFVTSLPQYLKDVLGFDITEDGVLSAIPSYCMFASSLLIGPLADYVRSKGVTTGVVRKVVQTVALLGIGMCLSGVGFITYKNRYVAIVLLGISGFFSGLQQAGYVANFIDIAPRFAGVLFGIGNSVATVSGFVSPQVVGAVTGGKSRAEWQIVFFACVAVTVVAAIVYVCFSKGEVQPWALEAPSSGEYSDTEYEARPQKHKCDDENNR